MSFTTALIPRGLIFMWHGLIADIPGGYVLCDGTNSTPDLRGRFVRGAADAQEPGSIGGSDTQALTAAQLPSHTHVMHGSLNGVTTGEMIPRVADYASNQDWVTQSVGTGGAHNNLPLYYEVLYIMKE